MYLMRKILIESKDYKQLVSDEAKDTKVNIVGWTIPQTEGYGWKEF